jgi:ribosome recycling factor
VKQAKAESEDAKIGIRSARQEGNKELKKLEISEDVLKDAEAGVQELTNSFIAKIDDALKLKEAEIMKV